MNPCSWPGVSQGYDGKNVHPRPGSRQKCLLRKLGVGGGGENQILSSVFRSTGAALPEPLSPRAKTDSFHKSSLGGRFGYFLFFSARGRGRGSPRRREGEARDFLLKIPGEGGSPGRGGEGPGRCLWGI